jgi:Hg(II)-responsive transcriptional regulator
MTVMKIGEIAKRCGVGVETIRYYEREGLLLAPERRPSGYRQYDDATIERLDYIRRAKELGFTLAEIRELLQLSFADSNCDHIRQRAEAKITDIEGKIRSLQQMKRSLGKIVACCRAGNVTVDCPLVYKSRKRPAG